MKPFFLGMLGFVFTLITYTFISAQYSDYVAEAEVGSWCLEAETTLEAINQSILKNGGFKKNLGKQSVKLTDTNNVKVSTNKMTPTGTIIIQGGHKNQLLVIVPTLTQKSISWQAYASPVKLLPSACKTLPALKLSH